MEKFWGFLSFKMGRKISFSWELGKKDATKHDIKEDFLRKFIDIWVDFNFRDSFLSKHDFCSSSIIWNNSLVRIADRPFFSTSIGQKLVYKISNILLTIILRS